MNEPSNPDFKYYNDPEIRKLIDAELSLIASLNCQIGIDTSKEDKDSLSQRISASLSVIKDLDIEFWDILCPTKDEEQ